MQKHRHQRMLSGNALNKKFRWLSRIADLLHPNSVLDTSLRDIPDRQKITLRMVEDICFTRRRIYRFVAKVEFDFLRCGGISSTLGFIEETEDALG